MVRWEPGAAERLRGAALDLYASRGFEQTTVAEIAAAAGVTERTFFRHFADKREVLFHGSAEFEGAFLSGVAAAPAAAYPMEVVARALDAAAELFPGERRPWSRRRQAVIDANPGLQERELFKLSSLATAWTAALRERGLPEPAAPLAAELGVTAFRVAFGQWIAPGERRELREIAHGVLRELRAIVETGEPR